MTSDGNGKKTLKILGNKKILSRYGLYGQVVFVFEYTMLFRMFRFVRILFIILYLFYLGSLYLLESYFQFIFLNYGNCLAYRPHVLGYGGMSY